MKVLVCAAVDALYYGSGSRQWSSKEMELPFMELGLDSLDLVQLRNAFNKHFRAKGRLDDEVPRAPQALAQRAFACI